MSSSRRPDRPRPRPIEILRRRSAGRLPGRGARSRLRPGRWRVRAWSLRTRLLAAVMVLMAGVCLVVGVATEAALRGFLIHQVDLRLHGAAGRSVRFVINPPPDTPAPGPRFLLVPGQGEGTLGAHLVHGRVNEAAVLDVHGNPQPLDISDDSILTGLPADGQPRTRNLGDYGLYRLVAVPTPDGDVIVTGLSLASVQDTLWRMSVLELAVSAGALLLAGVLGALILRHTLRPLRRVAATAARVTELPLDRGEVALPVRVADTDTDPGTEVGQVGAAINRMLGHVAAALAARHSSETRVRQFVADASHELRTPLAAIRGYAELTRRSRHAVPADVAYAMRRVESESGRMTALVEDLLLLARLDSGRPLATDEVDLSRLVLDAVNDAHIAGPRHRWRLDLPEEPVTVNGDAARLHQVLANLLANARAHTPAGTTVTTALARDPAGPVLLTVTDDGPGIPAELLPDVFERFARGDGSRSRSAGSTGLGLAIVAAVVAAHHGTVVADSEPGRTTLTVTLPP